VLGLAFFYTAHASALYLGAMSILMIGVAWCYTIICRCFQEGGGVYTVAKQLSPTLAVLGATLLLCDYVVTAALSVVDGMHYFGLSAPGPGESRIILVGLCIAAIAVIGIINWFGAQSAGRLALVIAIAALSLSAIIGVMSIPFFKIGLSGVSGGHESVSSWTDRWQSLVRIVLALSGVEAVANMTGLMRPPVPRTAKKTIWPVLIEVVVLNMVFGVALSGLPALMDAHKPDHIVHQVEPAMAAAAARETAERTRTVADTEIAARLTEIEKAGPPSEVLKYRDTAVRVLAEAVGLKVGGAALSRALGIAAGIIFGLLLISAVNTAVMATVSVLYSMAQDKELPKPLSRLNYSGVPWIGLVIACIIPSVLLIIMSDVAHLADLYAVGVCGAVTISVLGCVVNKRLAIKRWERTGMALVGAVMLAIETTIVVNKWHATLFASILIASVLVTRFILTRTAAAKTAPVPTPIAGWLAELRQEPPKLLSGSTRIMLAARGQDQAEYAVDLARKRGAVLFALYVRTLRIIDIQPGQLPKIEDDPEAQRTLGTAAVLAKQAGVPFFPIYVTSSEIADEILDYTATFGCDTLIMGKSQRGLFARAIEGDPVTKIAQNLPDGISLITRSSRAIHHDQSPAPDSASAP
jgi:amino acid transporter